MITRPILRQARYRRGARNAITGLLSILLIGISPGVLSQDAEVQGLSSECSGAKLVDRVNTGIDATPPDGRRAVRGVLAKCTLSKDVMTAIGQQAGEAQRFADSCRASFDEAQAKHATAENQCLFEYVRLIEEQTLVVAESTRSATVDSRIAHAMNTIAGAQRILVGLLEMNMHRAEAQ
jgi:hypothetical protein